MNLSKIALFALLLGSISMNQGAPKIDQATRGVASEASREVAVEKKTEVDADDQVVPFKQQLKNAENCVLNKPGALDLNEGDFADLIDNCADESYQ